MEVYCIYTVLGAHLTDAVGANKSYKRELEVANSTGGRVGRVIQSVSQRMLLLQRRPLLLRFHPITSSPRQRTHHQALHFRTHFSGAMDIQL